MKTLEETLQEITPIPDPDFVEQMEQRMHQGFPAEREPRLSRTKLKLPRLAPPAVAGAAASLVLGVLVLAALLGNQPSREPGPDRPVTAITPEAGGGRSADGSATADEATRPMADELARSSAPETSDIEPPLPPRRSGIAPNRGTRQVERSAEIALAADTAEFDRIADAIFGLAARRGGFVLQSQFTQGEEGISSGSFDLRVPVAELQGTLNALSALGTVRTRSESATDVTGRFVAVRDRLQIARADRRGLLRRLENAESDRAAQAIRRRLEIVAREINGLRSQLRRMRERTSYAAIAVELLDEEAGASSPASETREALDDAVGSLEGSARFLIRALGVLIPVALAGLLGWFAASRARRRARERALA